MKCYTIRGFEENIKEFLELFDFKDCDEAYLFINNVTNKLYKQHQTILANYSIISDNILNNFVPKHRLEIIKKELGNWLYKTHKKVDPTLPKNVVLLINFYYGIYIAYTDFLLLTKTDNEIINKQEIIAKLIYMFYVKKILSKLRGRTKTNINKDIMNRVILNLRASHNFRRFNNIHNALLNDSYNYAKKLFEKIYKEKKLKFLHTFWSSALHPKANKYGNELKDKYIKAVMAARTSFVDYDKEETTIIDKYNDYIHALILEREPIPELVDYVLYSIQKNVSKELLENTIRKIRELKKSDIENMLKELLKQLEINDLYISDDIKEKLKQKSRNLPFPIKLDKEYSLQTISNLKIAIYLYIMAYISRAYLNDYKHEIQSDININTNLNNSLEDDDYIW